MENGKIYRILAINPGGTSTKIGYFKNEKAVLTENVVHDEGELARFAEPGDQRELRFDAVVRTLTDAGVDIATCDAYVGRGGAMAPCPGGTYFVNERMLSDFRASPIKHPGNLGAQLSYRLAKEYGGFAFTVSSPDTDELCDSARFTGIKGVYRESHFHALNHKEVGHRYARSQGKRYEEMNLVICHIGTGSSVAAHRKGLAIDTSDNMSGDGPMCGTRCGSVAVRSIVRLLSSGRYTTAELNSFTDRKGGWMNLLGTTDALEIKKRIANGDEFARLVYDATIYQHAKTIGGFVAAMGEPTDAIIITGGIARDEYYTSELKRYVGGFAPVVVIAGEFELEALAAGALRHFTGEEPAKEYTGEPAWHGFHE
jgi:butyrate kinase